MMAAAKLEKIGSASSAAPEHVYQTLILDKAVFSKPKRAVAKDLRIRWALSSVFFW
jgi:hypothetical protein